MNRIKRAVQKRSQGHLRNSSQGSSSGATANVNASRGDGDLRGPSLEGRPRTAQNLDNQWSLPEREELYPGITSDQQDPSGPNTRTLQAFHDTPEEAASEQNVDSMNERSPPRHTRFEDDESDSKPKRRHSKLHKDPPPSVMAARMSNDSPRDGIADTDIPARTTSKRKTRMGRKSIDESGIRDSQTQPSERYYEGQYDEPIQPDRRHLNQSRQYEQQQHEPPRQYQHDQFEPEAGYQQRQSDPMMQLQGQREERPLQGQYSQDDPSMPYRDEQHTPAMRDGYQRGERPNHYQGQQDAPAVGDGHQRREQPTIQHQNERGAPPMQDSTSGQDDWDRYPLEEVQHAVYQPEDRYFSHAPRDAEQDTQRERDTQKAELEPFDRVQPHIDIDFDHTVHNRPAVTEETVRPHVHTIYQPERTRSYHYHEHRHYEQPLIDPSAKPEILPEQHYAQDHRTGEIFRIPDALGKELDRKYGKRSERGEAYDHVQDMLTGKMQNLDINNQEPQQKQQQSPVSMANRRFEHPHPTTNPTPSDSHIIPTSLAPSSSFSNTTTTTTTTTNNNNTTTNTKTDGPTKHSTLLTTLHPGHHPGHHSDLEDNNDPKDSSIISTMRAIAREDHGIHPDLAHRHQNQQQT